MIHFSCVKRFCLFSCVKSVFFLSSISHTISRDFLLVDMQVMRFHPFTWPQMNFWPKWFVSERDRKLFTKSQFTLHFTDIIAGEKRQATETYGLSIYRSNKNTRSKSWISIERSSGGARPRAWNGLVHKSLLVIGACLNRKYSCIHIPSIYSKSLTQNCLGDVLLTWKPSEIRLIPCLDASTFCFFPPTL